jgi:hypothetical protein
VALGPTLQRAACQWYWSRPRFLHSGGSVQAADLIADAVGGLARAMKTGTLMLKIFLNAPSYERDGHCAVPRTCPSTSRAHFTQVLTRKPPGSRAVYKNKR